MDVVKRAGVINALTKCSPSQIIREPPSPRSPVHAKVRLYDKAPNLPYV